MSGPFRALKAAKYSPRFSLDFTDSAWESYHCAAVCVSSSVVLTQTHQCCFWIPSPLTMDLFKCFVAEHSKRSGALCPLPQEVEYRLASSYVQPCYYCLLPAVIIQPSLCFIVQLKLAS